MSERRSYATLSDDIRSLIAGAVELEQQHRSDIDAVPTGHRSSARNLLHYLAVRRHDLRELQDQLAGAGLSSLGRMEAHTLDTLLAVDRALSALAGREPCGAPVDGPGYDEGRQLLERHADQILGPAIADGGRIMVTMPSEAAGEPGLVADLLAAGMTVMRVNTAHDDADGWRRMVEHLRHARTELGRDCRTSFDLGGPKLRTGSLGPCVGRVKWKPRRDDLGRVVRPARVAFTSASDGAPPLPADVVRSEAALIEQARVGDTIRIRDARGRDRELAVEMVTADHVVATSDRTGYITDDTRVRLERGGDEIADVGVCDLPRREPRLRLAPGDRLVLTRDQDDGREAVLDDLGRVAEPARIACTLPEVFEAVQRGQRIVFDDGAVEGTVAEVGPDELRVDITGPTSATLKADKGINLPDTALSVDALTDEDRSTLDAVVGLADVVALSFVREESDVEALHAELDRIGAGEVGTVLKIETRRGFENLPRLLLTALRRPPVAVMVARGDLAVEVGYERLAEAQEEILWICESAHVPVVWATQVLETLAKEGAPSRAEVTDAAWATRAECVMLNKGPHVDRSIAFVRDMHRRMSDHQRKRTGLLRSLSLSDSLVPRLRTDDEIRLSTG